MIAHSYLSPDNAIVLDHGASGDARLGRNYDSFSNLHIMRDLDEIIYLGSFAYAGFAESSAIYARISTDFDVVFNYDRADLRKLNVSIGSANISKTVRTEYRAGVKNYPV